MDRLVAQFVGNDGARVELGATVRAEPQCLLLRDRELPLFLNKKIIALWAFRLPLFEQLECQEAHDRAQLAGRTVFIRLQNYASLEDVAEALPELLRAFQRSVVQDVLKLGQVSNEKRTL